MQDKRKSDMAGLEGIPAIAIIGGVMALVPLSGVPRNAQLWLFDPVHRLPIRYI